MTSNPDIPFAKSIVDYVFRWLGLTFLEEYRKANLPDRGQSRPTDKPAASPTGAVTDDASSGSGRAEPASNKEGGRPLGALFESVYVSGPQQGGNGGRQGPQAALKAAAEPRTSRLPSWDKRLDKQFSYYQEDAPACDVCGSITVRNGNCYKCFNCGSSLGCS